MRILNSLKRSWRVVCKIRISEVVVILRPYSNLCYHRKIFSLMERQIPIYLIDNKIQKKKPAHF